MLRHAPIVRLAVAVAAFVAVPAAARAQDYALSDSTVAYAALGASEGTTLFTDSDDGFKEVTLPFTFRLFGRAYTKVWVSANGAVAFVGRDSVTGQVYPLPGVNANIPSAQQPQAVIAALWDDFVAVPSAPDGGSRVAWKVSGDAGEREVVIDWARMQLYGATGETAPTYSFALRLVEGSDQYEVRWGGKSGEGGLALTATSGVENHQGSAGLLHLACGNACGESDAAAGTGKIVSPNQNPELALTLSVMGAAEAGPTIAVTINNGGKIVAEGVTYDLYLSEDATLDKVADQKLFSLETPLTIGSAAAPPSTYTAEVVLPIPADVIGTRYVIGIVDPANTISEINKRNNVAATGAFIAGPELSLALSGQGSGVVGEKATYNVNVANNGMRAAENVSFRIEIESTDPTFAKRTLFAAEAFAIDALSSRPVPVSVDVPLDLFPGMYTVSAVVDPDGSVAEADETNNVAPTKVDVDVRGPDVGVNAVAAGSRIAYQGLPVPIRVALENRGPAKARDFTFSVYLSLNDVITRADTRVYTSDAVTINGNSTLVVNESALIPAATAKGSYYVGVIVDAEGKVLETDRSNNIRRSDDLLAVVAPVADLVVSSVAAQPKAAAGESLRVTALTTNSGATKAEFGYEVYLSTNATVSRNDLKVSSGRLTLERGEQRVIALEARVPPMLNAGAYTIGVLLDPAGEVAESDEANNSGTGSSTVDIVEPALAVITPGLPDGVRGIAYDVQLAARGATGSVAWSLESGTLPQGLTMDASGRISGTPLQQGLSVFVVQAKSAEVVALATYTLAVRAFASSLGLLDVRLPAARQHVSYSQQIGASGGNPPYRFSSSNATPPGLALAQDGTISGLPTLAGNYMLQITVEDNAGHRSTGAVAVDVFAEGALVIAATSRLREPEAGKPYAAVLPIEGGLAPYAVELVAGALPPGLGLGVDESGVKATLSGTPTTPGVFAFTIAASDTRGERDLAHLVLRVAPRTLSFVTVSLPEAEPGSSYSQPIETNARPPATYALVSGELPAGLTLDASGLISGTVASDAKRRIHAFAVQVKDGSGGEAIGAFSIDVPALRRDLSEGGCRTSDGAGLPLVLAALLAFALRRRRAAVPVVAAALVALVASPANAFYRYGRESASFTSISGGVELFADSAPSTYAALPVALPFPFKFYGVNQTSVGVSTTGLLSFGALNNDSSNTQIPSGAGPSNFIAPFWDGLKVSSATAGGASKISWKVEGSAPSRVFIVEWKNMQKNSSSESGAAYSSYSYQVRLHETTNAITIHYGGSGSTTGTAPTLTASIGIEGPGGSEGIEFSDTRCSPACGHAAFPTNAVFTFNLSPDLAIESVSAPPSIFMGAPTTVKTVIKNIGGSDASGVRVRYLLSTDTLEDESDIEIGTSQPASVLAGTSSAISTKVLVPVGDGGSDALPPGLYQLLAVVDPPREDAVEGSVLESREDNNGFPGVDVGLAPPAPDFTVSRLLASTFAEAGKPMTITRTIKNIGNKAGNGAFMVVLSANAQISASDLVLESNDSFTLAAGGSLDATVSIPVPASVVPGRYWLGLIVRPEAGTSELDSLNNEVVTPPMTIRGGALAITTAQLPDVTAGVPFSTQLAASGGSGENKWSIGFPMAPAGVTLSETGILSGVLDVSGEWPVQVQVLSGGRVVSKNFVLRAIGQSTPLAVVSQRLPVGAFGAPYSGYVVAHGGKPPYAWAMEGASALPAGLVLGADGALEGMPLDDGNATFRVKVTDSANATATGEVTLAIAGPTRPLFATRELPPATVDAAYDARLDAVGGAPPYKFNVVDTRRLATGPGDEVRSFVGSLPTGLELAEDGTISGTATTAGLYVVTVRVVDRQSHDDTASYVLSIGSDTVFGIRTASLPDATVQEDYSVDLQAQGGVGKLTWEAILLDGVSFPTGLTFTENGRIVGFPVAPGTVSFLAVARDAAGRFAMRPLALRVVAAPPAPVEEGGCNQTGAAGLLAVLAAAFALRLRRRAMLPALAAALAIAGSGCTGTPPPACLESCGAGFVCDELDGLCKCGGKGGAICGTGESCDAEARSCLVATCETRCPAPTTCGLDGACHCGSATGPVCAAGESCSALGRCEKRAVCEGVACAFGMTCDAGNQGQCRCGPGGPVCGAGERCVNGACEADKCAGVACTGGTLCDPADGVCKCGGAGGAVCVNGESCDTVNARCVRSSRCANVTCGSGEQCDPADGKCRCGGPGGPVCRDDQSCSPVEKQCLGGDKCAGVTCSGRTSCDPEDGTCKCGGFGGDVCGAGEICVTQGTARCETGCDPMRELCGENRACRYDEPAQLSYCVAKGPGLTGDECDVESPCSTKLHCLKNATSASTCVPYCNAASDCSTGEICRPFRSGSTLGYCTRS